MKEALWLAPANALARARLARYILFEPYDRLELGISYESLLKEALDLAPDDPEIRLVQISILRADGRTAEATKAASEALARFPSSGHP